MADLKHAPTPMTGVIAASAVTGTDVYYAGGEKLGNIHDVMLNEISDKIEFAILNFGGHFVGVNQRFFPLPWHLLQFDEARRAYVINIDRKSLDDAPTCELSDNGVWLNDGSGAQVSAFYATLAAPAANAGG